MQIETQNIDHIQSKKNEEKIDFMIHRKETNDDFMIFNDRRNTNELGELDILNLDLNVFQDDILKKKKCATDQFGFKNDNDKIKEDKKYSKEDKNAVNDDKVQKLDN